MHFGGGTTNLYEYSRNDPINFVDMTGFRPLSVAEANFLHGYFGDSLDTSVIDIGTSMGSRSWSPYGNRISMRESAFNGGVCGNGVNVGNAQDAAEFATSSGRGKSFRTTCTRA